MKHSRLTLFRLVLALSLFARATAPAIAAEDELPKRRPGLWRISTISPEVGLQTNDVCIEEGDSIIGAQEESCAKPSVAQANDQIIVTIECGPKDSREVVSLLFTGDFQNWYRAQSRMTAKGNRSGFTIDAKFLSERCTTKTPSLEGRDELCGSFGRGPISALSFKISVDDALRSCSSKTTGAYVWLVLAARAVRNDY